MAEILCTRCGHVGAPKGRSCPQCAGTELLPADSELARKFIQERKRRSAAGAATEGASARAAATGKVLGRTLGKLLRK